ncbi:L,D-transpeptidase family protein [Rodentibacter caecimuris]|uniref:L,D-transpeptidase n=1 Tax=Rodentibacter caecimuris TaxID=1796644 RepID=A0ABX3KX78_9PAST|nr:L,D-transpeptidase [Rodentibacter heylii]
MGMLKNTVKLTSISASIIASLLLSGCALADLTGDKRSLLEQHIDWSKYTPEERARLEQEIKADQTRLAAEKQAMLEMSLTHEIGEQNLQFKSLLAKLYAENKYELIWQDDLAKRQFLREYAAIVASGISKRSAQSLEIISKAENVGGLVYDVLITDAFLDYFYYAKNVNEFAQNWLYSHSYKAKQPSESDIRQWLSAVKNNELLNFINSLSTENKLYKQTIEVLAQQISSSGLTNTGYKLAINAQRLRVIPDFQNGIFVNIPSYRLEYYRDGQLMLDSRVIVGKDSRRTPVMYSKLSNVVVNPPWNPTRRLINEDIVPKMRNNPSYAASHNYTIIDSKGRAVDPYSIDWNNIGKNFPYHIRQAAGDSALGNYKFNMPSSDAIYLHDTPSRGLFSRKDRALSSGCVRVEKSDQLASVLLKEAGWSDERKRLVLESKKTTSAQIRSDNPVFLYYVTAWVDNGKINTLPDIYKYDRLPDLNYINWFTVKKYL